MDERPDTVSEAMAKVLAIARIGYVITSGSIYFTHNRARLNRFDGL